jgi:hypothetical protein
MTPQPLRYRKPDGSIATAYVFLDEEGLVQKATNLIELAGALQHAKMKQRAEAAKNTDPPGLLKMARTATKALVDESKAVVQGEPPVTQEVVDERLAICLGCERFIEDQKRCRDCGCFVKFKTRLRSQHCPRDKW